MIVRRASEIIRLALTMSQIQNTDALSWKDKVDMLNQSYIRLYDDLNNSGDLYYSKEVIFEKENPSGEKKFILPHDFWKLNTIGYKSSFGEIIPLERAPNTSPYYSGYKIINNELIMMNYYIPGPLVIRYIPQPQTLTYPRQGNRIPGNYYQAAYDSTADMLILGETDNVTVINNGSGEKISQIIEGNFVLAISGGIIYIVQETGITCFDYDLKELSYFDGIFDLYAHSIGWEEGIITSQSGNIMKYLSGGNSEPSDDYWHFIDGKIIRTVSDIITYTYITEEEVQDISWIFEGSDSYVISDPYIYINKSGSVKVYDEFMPTDISPAAIGKGSKKGLVLAAEANYESGYGIIFKDFYSGLNLLGFAADTVMNYPQNIFFDWITTDLAVKFRVALDIPTGELPALSDDYRDILMKGLSRDVFQNARINNVYGRAI